MRDSYSSLGAAHQHPPCQTSAALVTHVVVVVLDGLSREVEHGPGHDAFPDEVADFKVRRQHRLRVLVLGDTRTGHAYGVNVTKSETSKRRLWEATGGQAELQLRSTSDLRSEDQHVSRV